MVTTVQKLFLTFSIIGIVAFGANLLTRSFGVPGNPILFYGIGLLAFVCAVTTLWTFNQKNTQSSRFPTPTRRMKLASSLMFLGGAAQASVATFKSAALLFFLLGLLSYFAGAILLFQAYSKQTK